MRGAARDLTSACRHRIDPADLINENVRMVRRNCAVDFIDSSGERSVSHILICHAIDSLILSCTT